MTTIAPYRSPAAPGKNGFAQALRAELTKFRTVRGWIIGALVGVLVMAGVGLLASAGGQSSCQAVGAQGQPRSGSCGARHLLPPRPERRAGVRQLLLRPPAARGRRQHHRPGDLADRARPRAELPGQRQPGSRRRGVGQGRPHHQGEPHPGLRLRGDHGHRRPRRALAVELHGRHRRHARPGRSREPALAAADQVGRRDHRLRLGRRHALVAGRHGHPGRPPVDRAGRPVRRVTRLRRR